MSHTPHRLIERERKYLETGEAPKSYRNHELERLVEEKVSKLPERFQCLFEDIELLKQEGYLDVEPWADGWLELLDIDAPIVDTQIEKKFTHSSAEKDYRLTTPPADFGHDVGVMAGRLMLYPQAVGHESVWLDLAWGFLRGFYWTADESMHDSLKVLEERSQRKREASERASHGFENFRKLSKSVENRINTPIEEILEGDGIEPTSGLVQEVRNGLEDDRFGLLRKEVENEDWSIEENITPTVVREVLEENRVFEKRRFRGVIAEDAERLNEKGGSPSARDVFDEIFESENDVDSSREIDDSDRLHQTKDWTSRVTMFARDLAGVKDGNSGWKRRDIFIDRPLLRGNKEGWKTTAYGEAFGYYLRSHNSMWAISPLSPIPDDDLEAALDEFKAMDPEQTANWPSRDISVVDEYHFGPAEENQDES